MCEEWLADIWARHLPNVKVRRDLVLRDATQLGWAMRPQSPKLKAVLDEFVAGAQAKGLFEGFVAGADANARRSGRGLGTRSSLLFRSVRS